MFQKQLNHEKPVILLMLLNREKWHYFAVTKLSALLRGFSIRLFHQVFQCLQYLHLKA